MSTKSAVVSLANGVGKGPTLLDTIESAARKTITRSRRFHLYALTCYFDVEALAAFGRTMLRRIEGVKGRIEGLTVAVDAGEWIRAQASVTELRQVVADTSGVPVHLVRIVPVCIKARLLHAKAYAAMSVVGERKGFLVVTSGNATARGLGMVKNSNLELAVALTETECLDAFANLMANLLANEVSEAEALRQDHFLSALALFSAGAFYHRWQGSLASEVRFKMTLTEAGKRERARNAAAFRGYEPDSDTMSRDHLQIEQVFDALPKPFPSHFWRTYSVDTLLGYWTPLPVADLVDEKLAAEVVHYVSAIQRCTAPARVAHVAKDLEVEVSDYFDKGWIEESSEVVDMWRTRVSRFRENEAVLKLRIHPYERVPDVLDGGSRSVVLQMRKALLEQLQSKKRVGGIKAIVARFLAGELSRTELDAECVAVASQARDSLNRRSSR